MSYTSLVPRRPPCRHSDSNGDPRGKSPLGSPLPHTGSASAALESNQVSLAYQTSALTVEPHVIKYARHDLNVQSSPYKSDALTVELRA